MYIFMVIEPISDGLKDGYIKFSWKIERKKNI